MSTHLTMIGSDSGRIRSEAERDADEIWLRLRDSNGNASSALLSRAEAAKIMADLATAMGLIEAPKVAA